MTGPPTCSGRTTATAATCRPSCGPSASTATGWRWWGKPVSLGVRNDAEWEGALIEAPTLWREGDTYYLFFSANDYGSSLYAVGYATAKRCSAPIRRPREPDPGHRHGLANGPGGQAIVRGPGGGLWFAYHAWGELVGDDAGGQRSMWLDRLSFEDGRPRVAGPTDTPQEAP